MKPALPTVAALSLAAAALCGCVATSPEWESRFGDAARQVRAAQVVDPAAPSRNVAAPKIDGKAAAGAQTAYATSYGYAVREARQPPLTLAPVGGGQQ